MTTTVGTFREGNILPFRAAFPIENYGNYLVLKCHTSGKNVGSWLAFVWVSSVRRFVDLPWGEVVDFQPFIKISFPRKMSWAGTANYLWKWAWRASKWCHWLILIDGIRLYLSRDRCEFKGDHPVSKQLCAANWCNENKSKQTTLSWGRFLQFINFPSYFSRWKTSKSV